MEREAFSEAFYHVSRLELSWLLRYLSDPGPAGVLVLGEPGVGKTTLLSMAARELEWKGRPAFMVQLNDVEGTLGDRVLRAVETAHRSAVAGLRTVSSSSDYASPETTEILRRAGAVLGRPVLLLDALDESYSPSRVASEIAALSRSVGDHWKIVVTSRSRTAGGLGRLGSFRVLELPGFTFAEATSVVRAQAPSLSDRVVASIIEAANGNPLLLQVLARRLGTSAAVVEAATSVPDAFDWLVSDAIAESSNPGLLGELLERLALAGGRERIASLALKTHQPDRTVVRLLQASDARSLVVIDESAGTAALFHDILRDVVRPAGNHGRRRPGLRRLAGTEAVRPAAQDPHGR